MLVREMTRDDLARVVAIEERGISPWSYRKVLTELQQRAAIQLVVADRAGSDVVGWCCARYIASEAELLKMAIAGNCRRFGLATALLTTLERMLISHHVERLILEVRSENRGALRLYSKAGFTQVGFRPGYYSEPDDNALVMSKDLLAVPSGTNN